MKESKCSPMPWALDEYGGLIDAEGEPVEFKGVSLHMGSEGKERAIANRDMALAAPDLLAACQGLLRVMGIGPLGNPEHELRRMADREAATKAAVAVIARATKSVE